MANEVRGGAAEPAEMTCTPGADDYQTGLVACGGLGERDARVVVADLQRVLDSEIAELHKCRLGIVSDLFVVVFDVSRRPLAARVGAPNDRGRHTQIRAEPGRP